MHLYDINMDYRLNAIAQISILFILFQTLDFSFAFYT